MSNKDPVPRSEGLHRKTCVTQIDTQQQEDISDSIPIELMPVCFTYGGIQAFAHTPASFYRCLPAAIDESIAQFYCR